MGHTSRFRVNRFRLHLNSEVNSTGGNGESNPWSAHATERYHADVVYPTPWISATSAASWLSVLGFRLRVPGREQGGKSVQKRSKTGLRSGKHEVEAEGKVTKHNRKQPKKTQFSVFDSAGDGEGNGQGVKWHDLALLARFGTTVGRAPGREGGKLKAESRTVISSQSCAIRHGIHGWADASEAEGNFGLEPWRTV
jgi:hypothetical protein